MRSHKVEFWMPTPLYQACVKRTKCRQFKCLGRYLIALALRDMVESCRQELDAAIANANPNERDEMIGFYLSKFPTSRQEAIEQMHGITAVQRAKKAR